MVTDNPIHYASSVMTPMLESTFSAEMVVGDKHRLSYLDALSLLQNKSATVSIVLALLNQPMWPKLESSGLVKETQLWAHWACERAVITGFHCLDLTNSHDHWALDFSFGSTDGWLDPVHFIPSFGRHILDQICIDTTYSYCSR